MNLARTLLTWLLAVPVVILLRHAIEPAPWYVKVSGGAVAVMFAYVVVEAMWREA